MARVNEFRSRLIILACIAAALACHGCGGGGGGAAVSGAAFAPNYVYHLRGLSHWPHFPVRVYFDNGSEAYTPERAALAASGFDQWAAATGGQASFTIVDDPKQAQVTVHFVPQLEGNLIGWTTWRYDDNHNITSADVQMGVDGLDDRDIAWDGAHEIGHAMGIDGHSDQDVDVMFPSHVLGADWALTTRDVNTVKTDYSWLFAPGGTAPAAELGRATGGLHTVEVRCYRDR